MKPAKTPKTQNPPLKIDDYLQAATRDNTRRSYQQAIRHYEEVWGGFLPASSQSVARYLADCAADNSQGTLRLRLAALSQWHQSQGFADPTRDVTVKKLLKGIARLHPAKAKQAKPLQLAELEQLDEFLANQMGIETQAGDQPSELRACRDRALILLGFWRGFRGDELLRLEAQHLNFHDNRGVVCFLPASKGDRQNLGRSYRTPALARLCPVQACKAWLEKSGIQNGPLFRSINRWGQLGSEGMHINSLPKLLHKRFAEAGLAGASEFSSHSLRRGFANWASSNGWDARNLMEYVGWRDLKSAMRYLEEENGFQQARFNQALRQE